jgi:hypothetical protein
MGICTIEQITLVHYDSIVNFGAREREREREVRVRVRVRVRVWA